MINSGAGGGGGRIAIYYTDITSFEKTQIKAQGGIGSNYKQGIVTTSNGGSGTIFLKSSAQQYGDLIVNNKEITPQKNSTPLISVGQGTITDISPNMLIDANANFPVPNASIGSLGLIGLKIDPNINDNDPTTFSADARFF